MQENGALGGINATGTALANVISKMNLSIVSVPMCA